MLPLLALLAGTALGWWLGWMACEAKREILDESEPVEDHDLA